MANRILIVCYSGAGSTLRVAETLARAMDADLDQILELQPRDGVVGYLLSGLQALAGGLPTIEAQDDPRDHDFVVLGTPVWAGTMASPMRSYLFQHARHIQNAAFFAVKGNLGGDDVVHEMQIACGLNDAPCAVFTERDVRQDRAGAQIEQFVRDIERAARLRPARTSGFSAA